MGIDREFAQQFIASIDLEGTPREVVRQGAGETAQKVFDDAKDQARVVGSGLLSFAQGVTNEIRQAISDNALLAQLHANKATDPDANPQAWFEAYLDVLSNIGWVMQQMTWDDYSTEGQAAEVNEHIIEVLQAALGPAPAALAIVQAAVAALQKMQPDSSWFRIFSRESEHANMARFQVGLVEPGPTDDLTIYLLACLINAKKNVTQVLFFKFRSEKASFWAKSATASLNKDDVTALQAGIRSKVQDYQASYVSTIVDI